MAGNCLLAGVRKELVDVRKRDRIIETGPDGRERESMGEMSAEGPKTVVCAA